MGGKPTLDNVGNNCVQNSSHAKIVNTKISNGGEKKLNGRNTSGKDEDTSFIIGLVKSIRDINMRQTDVLSRAPLLP